MQPAISELHRFLLYTHISVPRHALDAIVRDTHADRKDRDQNGQHDRTLIIDKGIALRVTVLHVGDQHLRAQTNKKQRPEGKDLCVIDESKQGIHKEQQPKSDHRDTAGQTAHTPRIFHTDHSPFVSGRTITSGVGCAASLRDSPDSAVYAEVRSPFFADTSADEYGMS